MRIRNQAVRWLVAGIVAAYLPAHAAGQSIFQVVPTPNENFNNGLSAISASSASDIWAVGQSTIHYDGTQWTAFPAPGIKGNNTSYLGGVADFSPTNAWAVGSVGIGMASPGQVIAHWNGTQWGAVQGPTFASGDQPSLKALAAVSPDDMWAVGSLLSDGGQILNFLFEHWDGTAWTATTQISNDAFLFGVSADATNDVWAVGFIGPENDKSKPLVLHYDGKAWIYFSTPSVGSGANQFNGVAALAPDNVWAVGFSTAAAPPKQAPTMTLIEHWDGNGWSVVSSPNVGPKSIYQSNRLEGITAVSATDIWAYGSYTLADGSGQQKTLLLHWDGTAWSLAASPSPVKGTFVSDVLFAGVTVSPGNVWLVGSEDEAPYTGTLALHSTGAGPDQ